MRDLAKQALLEARVIDADAFQKAVKELSPLMPELVELEKLSR
jgi:hypothetical protein